MLDIRTIENNQSSSSCTSEFCNSRFISNTEMIKNWIFRVVYTIKKYKRNNPNQDFLVVVQYPQKNTVNTMLVSYADEVLNAEKEFGDKIMDMAMKGQKVRTGENLRAENFEIIKALKCLTQYAQAINSDNPDVASITCMKFQESSMENKLPKKNLPYKKMLFTFTHGPITVSSDSSNNVILVNARNEFDRMDVVTIGYRKTYEKPLFQSANGITYEYADYTDLLREKEINTIVSAICEDLQEEQELSAPTNPIELIEPCLLDVVFAVDAHFCECTTGLINACCAQSNKIIEQMSKFVNQVVDKLRKKGSYILGRDHTINKQALRVGFYSYYKNGASYNSDVIMEMSEWSLIEKTTSLDKFREAIFNNYKKPKVSDASNVNKVYLRNVLEETFDFGNSQARFLDKFSEQFSADVQSTHSQVFVIFPEDDSSETKPGSSGITNSLKLREGALEFKKKGIDVIAMPIKAEETVNRGLEYDAGLVNAVLDTPPNGDHWTALDEIDNSYDEERADKLVEAIYSLDDCPEAQDTPRKCHPIEWSCNATLEYSWSGCLMGPPGIEGKDGGVGEKGARGPRGLPGLPAPLGPQGNNGHDGECGKPGPQGPWGPKGDQGIKGDPGPQGAQGPKGRKGQDAKIDIVSWSSVHNSVRSNCGCKTCEKTISDPENICTKSDGSTCLKKQPVWWLGEHIDRKYFTDSIKEFLGDDFAEKAVNHLTMHGHSFDRASWNFYIEQVGTYLLGEEDFNKIKRVM